jgi:hypothetical protein
MCSVMEPETSMRQNITACAIGFGVGSRRRKRTSSRIDEGNDARAASELFQRARASPAISASRIIALQRGYLRGQRGDILAFGPFQGHAPRHGVAHGARHIERRPAGLWWKSPRAAKTPESPTSLRLARSGSSRSSRKRSRNSSADSAKRNSSMPSPSPEPPEPRRLPPRAGGCHRPGCNSCCPAAHIRACPLAGAL